MSKEKRDKEEDLFFKAKKYWREAKLALSSNSSSYDVRTAFMALGQAKWCLGRHTDSLEASSRGRSTSIVNPRQLLQAIDGELQRMKDYMEEDPFAALDCELGASKKDVKKAYHRLVRRWHPDKQTGRGEGSQDQSHELFIMLQRAYETLSDDDARRRISMKLSRKQNIRRVVTKKIFRTNDEPKRASESERKAPPVRTRQPAKSTFSRPAPVRTPVWKPKPSTKRDSNPSKPSSKTKSHGHVNSDTSNKASTVTRVDASVKTPDATRTKKKKSAPQMSATDVLRAAAAFRNSTSGSSSSDQNVRRTEAFDIHDFMKKHGTPTETAEEVDESEDAFSSTDVHSEEGESTTSSSSEESHMYRSIRVRAGPECEDIGDLHDPSEENDWHLSPSELVALQAHFAVFDEDDDGRITSKEFSSLTKILGETLSEDRVAQVVRGNFETSGKDCDSTQTYSFADFAEWWQRDDEDTTLVPPPRASRFPSVRRHEADCSSSSSDKSSSASVLNEKEKYDDRSGFKNDVNESSEIKFPPIFPRGKFWGTSASVSSPAPPEKKTSIEKEEKTEEKKILSKADDSVRQDSSSSTNATGGYFWGHR